ncbi:MAG TPA: PEP/pyruvate-binding domain-containing protein, partial [Gemmatimonadales bacterium]|nr:PEP/pyruvate-binding domain-containing protein [Gemmatimonadales bacterium]
HRALTAHRSAAVSCAVRSSAPAEDLAGASFAGQHGTYYYVGAARLVDVIRRCWASLWSAEAAAYRATRGIPHASVHMAVVVQEMVQSEVSGVAFTVNPVTGSPDHVVIEATWGMGAALVDGRVTPDRYLVARDGLTVRERRIAEKRVMVASRVSRERDARLERVSLSLQHRETLSDDQVRAVAQWSLKCERHFGAPQDVEWARADGRLYLLQSRPITTLEGTGRVGQRGIKGKWVLFKALAENFTDPMTPLSQDLLANPFPPGLRFIGGRLYLNLAMARPLVPFRLTDRELADVLYLTHAGSGRPLAVSWVRLPTTLLALLVNHLVFGVVMARTRDMPDDFMDRYRALCNRVVQDPATDPPTALRRLFTKPELLDPIGYMPVMVNLASMRFMPWMAVLRYLLRRWVTNPRPDAVALLCSGGEGVLSAEMGRRIAELAGEAGSVPAVRQIILSLEPEDALDRLRAEPDARAFLGRLDAFLGVHGHRAVREFEIAAPRWEENPAQVVGLIRNHLLASAGPPVHTSAAAPAAVRARYEAELAQALLPLPLERALGLRRRLIGLAARRARYYLKLRENSRFYHIMGLGAVRKKVLAVEAELLRGGKLKCRDDIFFLTWDEIHALREGRVAWSDLDTGVRERRMNHVRLSKMTPPRTIGLGPDPGAPDLVPDDGTTLRGFGASPGRYQGVARVILDPAVDAALHPGEVLVAPYTDPAWTPLFLVAGAAVVEVGSYLSHAGTVAREYGMPCVVDVPDAPLRIATGVRVEVDGDAGTVRILSDPSPGPVP